MQISYLQWYEAIKTRRSRRQYDTEKKIPNNILAELRTICAEFKPFQHVRAELITEGCGEVFKGIVGSYGKIKCAQAFIAFIGDMQDANIQEKVGYIGEGIILEATAHQLATCWVGGFFRPDIVASLVNIGENEKVLGVTPLGYAVESETLEEKIMTGFGRTHRRRPLSSLVSGLEINKWPNWIHKSLEAARQAPSAVNRQPWHFHVEPNIITVSIRSGVPEFNLSKRLDCGIAMLHIDVAATSSGASGKWEFLNNHLVARFLLST